MNTSLDCRCSVREMFVLILVPAALKKRKKKSSELVCRKIVFKNSLQSKLTVPDGFGPLLFYFYPASFATVAYRDTMFENSKSDNVAGSLILDVETQLCFLKPVLLILFARFVHVNIWRSPPSSGHDMYCITLSSLRIQYFVSSQIRAKPQRPGSLHALPLNYEF